MEVRRSSLCLELLTIFPLSSCWIDSLSPELRSIGIKVAYINIVEDWFGGPPLLSKKGRYVWTLMTVLYWALAFVVGLVSSSVPSSDMIRPKTWKTCWTFLGFNRLSQQCGHSTSSNSFRSHRGCLYPTVHLLVPSTALVGPRNAYRCLWRWSRVWARQRSRSAGYLEGRESLEKSECGSILSARGSLSLLI